MTTDVDAEGLPDVSAAAPWLAMRAAGSNAVREKESVRARGDAG